MQKHWEWKDANANAESQCSNGEMEKAAKDWDMAGTVRKRNKPSEKTRATVHQLMKKIREQNYRCALSGVLITPKTAHLDHIVPLSEGGDNSIANLQWLHEDVNTAKGTMTQQQFVEMCRLVTQYTR